MPHLPKLFPVTRLSYAFCLAVSLALFAPSHIAAAATSQTTGTTVQAKLITVHAPARLAGYANNLLGHATAAVRALNEQTDDALLVPVTYEVLETQEQFFKETGGEGENTLAVALGSQQRVLINYEAMSRTGADKIRQVLVHELAHVYLEVKCNAPVPRWVHEGVAQDVAGEWPEGPGEAQMALAAYTGGLLPLRELVHTFPADASRRNQAYAESLSALKFVIRQDYGGSLPAFLKAIQGDKGTQYLETLGRGISLEALDLRWRNELKSPLFLLGIITGSGFFWGIASVLVIMAWLVKRRRSRLIRQQWAREEAMTGEFESIIDRIERYDEAAEHERGEDWEPGDELLPEETPYDQYLAEQEEADPDDSKWRS